MSLSYPLRRRVGVKIAVLALVGIFCFPQDERPPYKTKYRVINVHHHWGDPDADVVRAQIEAMDANGIATAVNLDAGRADGNLRGWIELERKNPGRLVNFAKFTTKDFERIKEPAFFDDLVRELERAAKMGIRGFKIWKDLGMV